MSLIMRCEPCGKSFNGPVSYGQHIESDKHKKKVSSWNILSNSNEKKVLTASEILSPNSFDYSRDSFECSTCRLRFNSFEDFQTHTLSTEHAKKIIENTQMNVENANNMESLLIDSSVHSNNVGSNSNEISDKSDTIIPEVEMFKSQASFSFCNTCKKHFSGLESYKQHIVSAGHLKKTELESKIALGINLAFSCAPCKKTFSGQVPYDQHMNSDTHRKKIQSLQLLEKFEVDSDLKVNMTVLDPGPLNKENNPWYCKTCDIICSGPAPFEQHNKGVTHLKNLLKAQREKSTDDVLCTSLQINGINMAKKDIILSGLVDNNEDAHIAKLDESITVFLPEEEIDFDEQNSKINMKFEEPVDEIDSDEKNNKTNLKLVEPEEIDFEEQNKTNLKLSDKNSDELELIQITLDECSLTMQGKENIPENKIEEKSDVFQVCSYCNVELYNKDEVMNHFESLEHFRRRWN